MALTNLFTMLKMDFPNPFFSSFIADGVCIFKCLFNRDTECCRVGKESILITLEYNSALLKFESPAGKFCVYHDPLSFPKSNQMVDFSLLLIDWLLGSIFLDMSCQQLIK